VAGLVIGVVAVHALLVQTQYAMRSAARESSRLEIEHQDLVKRVAQLSSPARVAAWAHDRGMVTPTDVVILRIPGTGDATHAPAAGANG
jgi:cell division protein FtsL